MKIPYGLSNFKALREEKYLYVDKTKYIKTIENLNSKYVFFIRPRRFGKSLFLSTLEHYYDIGAESEFNNLFGELYIGKNETKLKNSYLILKLNFSGLNTDTKEKLERSFRLSLVEAAKVFLSKYKSVIKDVSKIELEVKNTRDLRTLLTLLLNAVRKADKKIYLIIDEYDHFANDIIAMGDSTFYKDVIRATGFVRDFYETVKIGTETVIDRIFITGISPVMLDDLTSGFNIASNITLDIGLNEMLGFTDKEIKEIVVNCNVDELTKKSNVSVEESALMHELKKNYNGYLFNEDAKYRVYNPDMVLYFFDQWQKSSAYPKKLIDDNVKTDYGRLNRLMLNDENRRKLEDIIKNEGIISNIATRFSFDNMNDEDNFVSLLFYMGLLTIDRQERTRLRLKTPNYVVNTIFWEYFEKKLRKEHSIRIETEPVRLAIEKMAYDGEIEPYISFISQNILKPLSNRDMIKMDEKHIKILLFTYISASNAYRPTSEKEIENGYFDIFLEKDPRIPDIKYEWIIELKYLKKSEIKQIEEAKTEGLKQLRRYAMSSEFEGKKNLKKALVIFSGKSDYEIVPFNEEGS
ncbi:MAG: AAA family ATPase [Alkaliphilus sp.]